MHNSQQKDSLNQTQSIPGSLPHGASCVASKLFSVADDPRLKLTSAFDYSTPCSQGDLCVVGIAADNTACGHYRLKFPLLELERLGAEVRLAYVSDLSELDMRIFKNATHVILSRCSDSDLFQVIRAYCNREDITLIFDLDDCFHEIHPENPAYAFYDPETEFGRTNIQNMESHLQKADGVIFSTRELKAYYDYLTPYSHILPNGLDLDMSLRNWDDPDKVAWKTAAESQGCRVQEDTVVLGWMGSITHINDLKTIGPAVKQVLTQNPQALLGMYCDVELAMHCCLTEWQLPMDSFFLIPPTSFDYYPEKIGSFDIGLSPLENTVFNRCKSDLRLLEFGAQGVPYVASKVAPYWRFHLQSQGMGGFIATSTQEWVEYINLLIRKKEERRIRGATLKSYVYNHCSVRNSASTLVYTLKTIRENSYSFTKAPAAVLMQDTYQGIPRPQKHYAPTDDCPCGSAQVYDRCSRNCAPAWG